MAVWGRSPQRTVCAAARTLDGKQRPQTRPLRPLFFVAEFRYPVADFRMNSSIEGDRDSSEHCSTYSQCTPAASSAN